MFKRVSAKFPTFGNKNISLYYLLTIFMNGWFILPNWVFYYALYTSIVKIGIIDGISKLVQVVLEVPSGTISDVFGKRNTLILGNAFFVLCNIILILAHDFTWLLVGNIVMFVGFALVSGAKEALLYDSLIDIDKENEYDEVLGKVNSVAIFTTILAVFIGGLIFRFDPALPFAAWLLFNVVAIVLLLFIQEPKVDDQAISYATYLSKLKTGAQSIFKKPLIGFVLPVLFFSMLIRAYEGVVRQNTGAYFGFTGETFGYLFALITIPALIASFNYGKISRWLKHHTEFLIGGLYVIGFLIVYLTNNIFLGVVSFLSVYIAQELAYPFIFSMINKNTESKHRATALSTVSLFAQFPYLLIVLVFGGMLEIPNIHYLYGLFALATLAYIIVRGVYRKSQ